MKFRFKVLKNWIVEFQYKKFLIWRDYNKDRYLQKFILDRYKNSDYLRARPLIDISDEDYREFIKKFTNEWNDYCKEADKYKKWFKTDYYIK